MSSGGTAAAGALDAGVGRAFAALGGGEIIARLLAFAAAVLLARRLGAAAFGVVAFAGAVILYFQHLTDFGVDTVGVARVARDREYVDRAVPAVLLARLLLALILGLILLAAGLALPQPDGAILAATGTLLLARGLNARWVLVGLDRSGTAAIARTAGELVTTLLVIFLVREAGSIGLVPVTQLAGDGLTVLLMGLALRRQGFALRVPLRLTEAMPLLRDSLPLVAHALLAMVIFNFDLIALRFFVDSAAVGLYATAYVLVSFLTNLGVSFGFSLLPAMSRAAGQGEGQALYSTGLAHAVLFSLPFAVGGMLLAGGLIELVFGAEYAAAGVPLAILVWSVPLAWARLTAQMQLVSHGRQADVLRATLASALLTIVLDLLLIPRWGMTGAAAATVAAEALRLLLMLSYAAREGRRVPGPSRFWRAAAAATLMGVIVAALPGHVLFALAAGALLYPLALAATGALRISRDAGLSLRV